MVTRGAWIQFACFFSDFWSYHIYHRLFTRNKLLNFSRPRSLIDYMVRRLTRIKLNLVKEYFN